MYCWLLKGLASVGKKQQTGTGRNRLKILLCTLFAVFTKKWATKVIMYFRWCIDAKDELSTSNIAKSLNLTYHESFGCK